jgi:serine O-acetyltransferase
MSRRGIRAYVRLIRERDPAARSLVEVLLCYPGGHAVAVHRLSHWLWQRGLRLPARLLSNLARVLTGVEIHPGAVVGSNVFIDHGTGIVIGETAEVGDGCTLYQGVTLGGRTLNQGKRHPTLGSDVTVGAGAKILGPIEVGDEARIGSNAVVLQDVPRDTTWVGIPARQVLRREERGDGDFAFVPYGVTDAGSDPVAEALQDAKRRIDGLEAEIKELRCRLAPEDFGETRRPETEMPMTRSEQ